MDVILHIGAHRTASTALQRYWAKNRGALQQQGTVYWGPKITRGGLFRGAIGCIDGVLPWQQRRFAGRCAMRADVVENAGADRLIVSDENMLGSLRGTLEDTRLYHDAGHRVAAYAAGFRRHRVTVALCVRSYGEWWTSAVAFRLSRGGPLPRAQMREHLVTQPRRWRHIIEEIAQALPDAKLVVWTYERSAHCLSHLSKELTACALSDANAGRCNLRPDAEALRRAMIDIDVDPAEFDWPDGQFRPFAAHELDALKAQYDEDLAWLAQGAGGFADYINVPHDEAPTGYGRGLTDDGDTRHLA